MESRGLMDREIVDPRVYASMPRYHALFSRLRAEDPVHWTAPEGYGLKRLPIEYPMK